MLDAPGSFLPGQIQILLQPHQVKQALRMQRAAHVIAHTVIGVCPASEPLTERE